MYGTVKYAIASLAVVSVCFIVSFSKFCSFLHLLVVNGVHYYSKLVSPYKYLVMPRVL